MWSTFFDPRHKTPTKRFKNGSPPTLVNKVAAKQPNQQLWAKVRNILSIITISNEHVVMIGNDLGND